LQFYQVEVEIYSKKIFFDDNAHGPASSCSLKKESLSEVTTFCAKTIGSS